MKLLLDRIGTLGQFTLEASQRSLALAEASHALKSMYFHLNSLQLGPSGYL
jgi:hypothetical protein